MTVIIVHLKLNYLIKITKKLHSFLKSSRLIINNSDEKRGLELAGNHFDRYIYIYINRNQSRTLL